MSCNKRSRQDLSNSSSETVLEDSKLLHSILATLGLGHFLFIALVNSRWFRAYKQCEHGLSRKPITWHGISLPPDDMLDEQRSR